MGQISNILDGRIVRPVGATRHAPRPIETANAARVIPGSRISRASRLRFPEQDLVACGASLCTSCLTGLVLWHSRGNVKYAALSLATVASCIIAAIGRRAIAQFVANSSGDRNVLVVGSGSSVKAMLDAIETDAAIRRSVKAICTEQEFQDLCASGKFATFARQEFVDELVVTSRGATIQAVLNEARRLHLDVTVTPQALGLVESEELAIEDAGHLKLIRVQHAYVPVTRLRVKRLLDILLALFGIAALLPLLLSIAVLVGLDSRGTVLYRSWRVGLKGRKFRCFKFRTMVVNAEASKEELRARNERTGAFFKITDDPRITRIGKILRRYSLDELPQLWNVLRGDMSLVGPRPHPPDDLERYGTQHLRRLDFVPGITGLWQVTARHDPSFEKSVALDVEYIQNWSLWLDLRILFRTVGAVVRGSGV